MTNSKCANKKIIVTGHGGHGKDTFCEMLEVLHCSSSYMANELFIFTQLKDKYGYKTKEDCYMDRRNHRNEWFDLIREYNTPDKARLAQRILNIYNVYNGVRCIEELQAIREQGLVDLTIWISAKRDNLPPESQASMTVTSRDCDIIIDNRGSLDDLRMKALKLKHIIWPE